MARATDSSLNGQRSSKEPPPRPTMRTSNPPRRLSTLDALGDLAGRDIALHLGGVEQHLDVREAAVKNPADVANGGSRGRRHDADPLR